MKRLQITCIILLMLTASARGQLLLNSGDVYTYQFGTLPHLGSAPCFGDMPTGGFAFSLAEGTFDASSDVLSVEMFENGTNEPPLTSFVTESGTDGTALYFAWADFQGTVRFTVVSGSVTLQGINFYYETPTGGGFCDRYGLQVFPGRATTPVIDRFERESNAIRFHFTGEPLYDYTVEFTDSLTGRNWVPLTTYRAKIQTIDVVVTNSFTNAQARFFRVRKEHCLCRGDE